MGSPTLLNGTSSHMQLIHLVINHIFTVLTTLLITDTDTQIHVQNHINSDEKKCLCFSITLLLNITRIDEAVDYLPFLIFNKYFTHTAIAMFITQNATKHSLLSSEVIILNLSL